MSEEKLVPKLRFSGFTDEWNEVKLGDISKSITKGTTPKKYSDTGINFVKVESIENNKIYKIDAFIDENTHKNELSRSILKTNDLLFSIAGSLGRTTIVTENILPANTNQALSIIRFYDNCNCNLNFIQSRLNTYDIAKYIFQNLAVGAQPNLNLQQVGNIKIRIPSFNEQNKIQGFLECVDIKIELLKKKYQQYQEFKKYLMQQIFTQKLRFNFTDGWKVVKLETLIKKGKAGGTPSSTNLDYYNGDIPFLSIKDMTEQGKYIVKTEKSITNEGLNNSSAWIIPKYSLLYSIYASIGLVAINRTEISTSQAIYGIILKEGVSLEYMYYYLTYFKKNVHRYIETGTQGNLNAKLLKSFEVLLPSLKEQEMIVNILSLADEKIENTEKEIIKMNEFKKGLLQQMFV